MRQNRLASLEMNFTQLIDRLDPRRWVGQGVDGPQLAVRRVIRNVFIYESPCSCPI